MTNVSSGPNPRPAFRPPLRLSPPASSQPALSPRPAGSSSSANTATHSEESNLWWMALGDTVMIGLTALCFSLADDMQISGCYGDTVQHEPSTFGMLDISVQTDDDVIHEKAMAIINKFMNSDHATQMRFEDLNQAFAEASPEVKKAVLHALHISDPNVINALAEVETTKEAVQYYPPARYIPGCDPVADKFIQPDHILIQPDDLSRISALMHQHFNSDSSWTAVNQGLIDQIKAIATVTATTTGAVMATNSPAQLQPEPVPVLAGDSDPPDPTELSEAAPDTPPTASPIATALNWAGNTAKLIGANTIVGVGTFGVLPTIRLGARAVRVGAYFFNSSTTHRTMTTVLDKTDSLVLLGNIRDFFSESVFGEQTVS